MNHKQLWTDLSDEQCQKVVGGVGFGEPPGAGVNGWNGNGNDAGLKFAAGFDAPGVAYEAGASGVIVTRPF